MNSKNTKRALVSSVIAMALCLAMLVGTTFAWFTDTASTSVNTVRSGSLDVALEMQKADGTWENAEGKTLDFKKAAGAEAEKILWEPGCSYELPALRVKNDGNLALKYKVQISGIMGDAKLNEVIEWTMGDTALGSEYHLKAGETSAAFVIKGRMQETAGNDYMNLSINGIAISIVATQDTVESDSYGKDYDQLAEYPVYAAVSVETDENGLLSGETKLASSEKHEDTDLPVASATVPAGAQLKENASQLELVIKKAENPANFTADTTQNEPKTLDISMKGLAEDNDKLIKVEFFIEKGLSLLEINHNGRRMSRCSALKWLDADQELYYDSATGLVTMLTKTFSPFTYTSDKFYWDDKKAESYKTPVDTLNKIITVASAEELALFKYEITDKKVDYSGYTLNITNDIDLGRGFWRPIDPIKGMTINGNGHKISNLLVRSCTNSSGYGFGFIGNASGTVNIRDLTFDGADVAMGKGYVYYGNVGSIVLAYAYGTTTFDNVHVVNSSLNGYGKIGMLLGMGADPGVKITFKNCVSQNNIIRAVYNIGGLAGNIQRGNGSDNATVENCTVSGIDVVYDSRESYVDIQNAEATLKSNDKKDGTDVAKTISGKWWIYDGYYWGGYADYYISYGNSSYDAPVSGYGSSLANSEYCVNK